jgi:Flp pilus assembly protein TadG
MRSIKRLSSEEGGSVLIEYAMLAPVFFMLVFGLVEFVLFQYKANALNYVTYEAARVLQTGKVQGSADMAKAFHDQVCDAAGTLLDCESVVFDVRNYGAVNEVKYETPEFDPKTGKPLNFLFEPGGAGRYSVVRASMNYTFITPFMGKLFGMGPDLPAIVNAYCIVRNEPWA